MKYTIAFLFLVALTFSCNTDDDLKYEENVFGFTNYEEAKNKLGMYADFFARTEGIMKIRYSDHQISQNKIGEILARMHEPISFNRIAGGDFQVGDISLSYNASSSRYELANGDIGNNDTRISRIEPLFGRINTVKYSENNKEIFNFEQYSPEIIDVEVENEIDNDRTNAKGVSRKDFTIEWNKDSKNENGIVCFLSWHGDSLDSNPYENDPSSNILQRAIKIEDNGKATLDESFFDDIPKNAVIVIYFIRGMIDIKSSDNISYKFYTTSQDQHGLVLID